MDFRTFKDRFSELPIILSKDVLERSGPDGNSPAGHQALLNQLNRWQSRGLLVRLRKGVYLLNKSDRKIEPSSTYLANQLYTPSYVSLEYALSFYGLIPERVHDITSVTTKKTIRFSNSFGHFGYRHVTPAAFRGFKIIKDHNGLDVFMAEPEKAVVDFLYFTFGRDPRAKEKSPDIFNESYRFEDVGTLKEKRILELANLFNNPNLTAMAKLFCKFRREYIKA
ncbi:MAG: hypothetical protein M1469_02570 [Bacteroidetes bacterium]|nr:hypothetical protein [Bacteroidota bacterium]